MNSKGTPTSARNPILWGAYLACSWTWCIGMFLPILLLREMGWGGYLIFALPNIIGAAAMGWTIKNGSDSVRFVENHARAIWWFSAVTLVFHVYWIFWISSFLPLALGISGKYLAGGLGFICIFALIAGWTVRRGHAQKTALGLFVLSLTVLMGTLISPELKEANASLLNAATKPSDSFWMLPVMLFGFLLCPYLDITFHHARQQLDSKSNGRLGFTIGFVALFPFMIFLTTRYAGLFTEAMNGEGLASGIRPGLAVGILLHIICQWFFTVSVHLDRMRTIPKADAGKIILVVILILGGIAGVFIPGLPAYRGLLAGEIGYRLFMSAYGLVFPAYVLYQVIFRKKTSSMMWILIALTAPFFWMGFIERQTIWLIPGMVILLLGAFIRLKK